MQYSTNDRKAVIKTVKQHTDNLLFSAEKYKPKDEYEFALYYLNEAYKLLSSMLKYDHKSVGQYLEALKHNQNLYNELFSLNHCILQNTGMCKHFTEYLILLAANTQTDLENMLSSKLTVDIFSEIENKTTFHAANMFDFRGQEQTLISDVTRGVLMRDNNLNQDIFCLNTKEEYKQNLYNICKEKLPKTGEKTTISRDSVENLYDYFVENSNKVITFTVTDANLEK